MHDSLLQDLRYGLRTLIRNPGLAIVAVLSLTLGIGANTTIFSLVNALLLRPLPVSRPGEVVAVYTSDYSGPLFGTSSYPDYLEFRDKNEALSGLAAYTLTPVIIRNGVETERVFAEMVSGNYFSVLGIETALGRAFLPEEDQTPNTSAVVVLGYGFWERRFARDPGAIGQTIIINGNPFTVVGVAREGFSGLTRGVAAELWVPAMMQAQIMPGSNTLTARGNRSMFLMGRLKPGVTLEQAQANFNVLATQMKEAYPGNWTNVRKEGRSLTLLPESEARIFPNLRGAVVGFLALLMIVVGLVLLIACANIANLLLARATARRKEFAIRLALGAGPGRLIRQLLTESILLAILGGAGGLLLALWATSLLLAFKPPVPVPVLIDLSIDGRVLIFTLLASLVTGVIFGLAPALQSARPDLVPALKDEASTRGYRRSRLRNLFVISQVALSLMLLIGAGLFLRSLRNASAIQPGFDPNNVLLMSVDLQLQGYDEPRGRLLYEEMVSRLKSVPGVQSVALAEIPPLSLMFTRRGISIEGYTPQPGEDMEFGANIVGPGYFETLRIPVLRGRTFGEQDSEGAPLVAVINETFARRFWPGEDAIGRRIGRGGKAIEIVGVVKDGKYQTLGEEPQPYFYLPALQTYQPAMTLMVRAEGEPTSFLPALQAELQAVDPNLPVFDIKTLIESMSTTLLPARMAAVLLAVFGGVALVLASVGLYGVMSFSVSQRTREIGIRMALGADSSDVLRLIVGHGMMLTFVGLGLGLAGAVALSRLMTSLLYGISATDPATFLVISVLLASVAFVASYIPARRAAKVDPMIALRYE